MWKGKGQARALAGQLCDFEGGGDEGEVGHVEEEAMLDDTDDLADGCGELVGVFDDAAFAVEDEVAFIGDVVGSGLCTADGWVDSEVVKFARDQGGGHGDDFDWKREGAEMLDDFTGVGDDDELSGGAGYDLFAKECAAAAFDQRKAGCNLVGSIDGDVDLGAGVEVDDGDGEGCGEVFAGFR